MNYVPIRLRTLIPNIEFDFNVYLKLNDKYLLYVREGDDIEYKRLKHLVEKKVKQLFIVDQDENKYQKFLDRGLMEAADNPMMSAKDRAVTASGVAGAAVEDMHEDPESFATYKLLERGAKGIVRIVGKKQDVLKEFYKVVKESEADPNFKHAITVASLATCLGDVLQLQDQDLEYLGVSAMLLDIGMVKMTKEARTLFTRNYKEFTNDDWIQYRQHPIHSANILNGKEYINKTILELVASHEERRSGEGFPTGKKDVNLKQEILGICSCYDRMVTCLGIKPDDALSDIQINQLGNFDLELIKQFKKMLKSQGVFI